MISLTINKLIDGAQLNLELEQDGIEVEKDKSGNFIDPAIDGQGLLWLAISEKNKDKAKAILDKHIPKPATEPTVEEKLASVGLTTADLKAALGL